MDPSPRDTSEIIAPILYETYGKSAMAEALVPHLADYIDGYSGVNRQQGILNACWNWFPGGDTALGVATRIEHALSARDGQKERSDG